VRNYGGIILLCTVYKIYAAILAEKLREEIELKGSLPEIQAAFRKGRETMDNVRILQQVINKEISKRKGKCRFFIDLKAAFDKVDRKIMWKAMEERGIRRGLIERVKEIYEESKNAVRVHENITNWFGTRKGVRQRYPLSSLLFALVIADVKEEMKKGQIGGLLIGKNRIWTLVYADDLVLLIKNEESMKETIKRLERYLRNKNLQLNAEKSKMLCFRKGEVRRVK